MATGRSLSDLLAPPLAVVTTAVDGERSGCLIGFFTQCSIHPERYLVCLSIVNHTYRLAERASALALHVLEEDQRELAERFGEATGDEVDKFSGLEVETGALGVPLLSGCAARIEARILERIPLGDHVGFLLEPADADLVRGAEPLRFGDVPLEAAHPPEESVGIVGGPPA